MAKKEITGESWVTNCDLKEGKHEQVVIYDQFSVE